VNILPISACLIVRDEESSLPRCLASLAPHVAEIVVVDTGSRDRTVEIAKAHGAILGHHVWDEDFSAARNASLALATQPWILAIDADEELLTKSVEALETAIALPNLGVLVRMRLLDQFGGHQEVPLARLFRNDPRIRFRRAIHESVNESLWDAGETAPPQTDVILVHHGYAREVVDARAKIERNLRIHRRVRESGKADAYDLFKQAQILQAPDLMPERREVLEASWNLFTQALPEHRTQWPWGGKLRALFGQILSQAGELSRACDVMELVQEEVATLELPVARLEWAWHTGDWSTLECDALHARRLGNGAAALEADTRCARTRADRAALERIAASMSIEATVWLSLLELEAGHGEKGMEILARPMGMAPHDPLVRLASGIFLAHYGDLKNAVDLFASIDGFCSPLGRCWEFAIRLCQGQTPMEVLAAMPPPVHHEEAALALELARRSQVPFLPDTAFDPELLERRRLAWQNFLDTRL
jgi:hypothetical protein